MLYNNEYEKIIKLLNNYSKKVVTRNLYGYTDMQSFLGYLQSDGFLSRFFDAYQVNDINIKKIKDKVIIYGEYATVEDLFALKNQLDFDYKISIYKDGKMEYDIRKGDKFIITKILDYVCNNIYLDSVKYVNAENKKKEIEKSKHDNDQYVMDQVRSVIDDIKTLSSIFSNKVFYNDPIFYDRYINVYADSYYEGETDYYDGKFMGTNYKLCIKTEDFKEIEVFNTFIANEKNMDYKSNIKVYREGVWEEYLHNLVLDIKKERQKKLEKEKAILLEKKRQEKLQKEYKESLRFLPIDDEYIFKKSR